jgi:hypothetical protein
VTPLDASQLKLLYKPSAKAPALVEVPPMRFLQLDGVGDIGGPTFTEAIGALYGLAYPLKFGAAKALGLTYKVGPLEGLYWQGDGSHGFDAASKEPMSWRLMIMVPNEVDGDFIEATRAQVIAKKNPPRLPDVRVQTFSEGMSVQIMYVGPYADEPPTIERLFAFAEESGYDVTGHHHEIYIGDPNRSAPEKLKTVLRYGVRKAKA